MARPGLIPFAPAPVDQSHTLSRNRSLWWLPISPLAGGAKLYDLNGLCHATLTSNPTWTGTPYGSPGLLFSGSNYASYTFGSSISLTQVTMVGWVKNGPSVGNDSRQIALGNGTSNSPGFNIEAGSDVGNPPSQTCIFFRNDANTVAGRCLLSGGATNWARIMATLDLVSGTVQGYINGVQAGTASGFSGTCTINNIALGGWLRASGPTTLSNCTITDVSLYLGFAADSKFALLDYELSVRNYLTPDSPLRWWRPHGWILGSASATAFLPSFSPGF